MSSIRLNRLLISYALIGVLALLHFTPAEGAASSSASAALNAAPASSIDLQPCQLNGSVKAECGTLRVYEDRLTRTGRQIDLRVAVLRARGSDVRPDPIFFLAGGPGIPATQISAYAATLFASAREYRDIVLVDQRGTGGSHELLCPAFDSAKFAESGQRYLADYVKNCLATIDADPRFYTTAMAMDDVDDVRAALGYDKVNIYGVSYGATAAQVYLRQHADHVRAAVIAFGTLLDVPIFERVAYSSQLALDIMFERCTNDILCHAAFPDLRQEFETVMQRLKQHPLTTTIIDPAGQQPIIVNDRVFAGAVHGMLLSTIDVVKLPRLIHRAYKLGDVESLMRSTPAGGIAPTLMMSSIIRCFDAWAAFQPENVQKAGESYLKEAQFELALAQQQLCRLLPDPGTAAIYPPRAESDVPVLILTGGADPQNPPQNMADSQHIWSNSLWVIFPKHGHALPNSTCLPYILSQFFKEGDTQGIDVSCAQHLSLSSFDITS